MTSVQFAFVKLVVRDLDAMSGFYQRALAAFCCKESFFDRHLNSKHRLTSVHFLHRCCAGFAAQTTMFWTKWLVDIITLPVTETIDDKRAPLCAKPPHEVLPIGPTRKEGYTAADIASV
jgi:hypothetical protein